MSSQVLAQVEDLIARLRHLDLQQPDEFLQQRLGDLKNTIGSLTAHTTSSEDSTVSHTEDSTGNDPSPPYLGSLTSGSPSAPQKTSYFPFVPVPVPEGQMKPSLTAFKTAGVPRQFGIPPSGVNALQPPLELFIYDANSISPLGKPQMEELVPAPSAPPLPPGEGKLPQAPVYKLAVDPGYRRGYIYTADFNLDDKKIEHENMLNIQPPPNVKPSRFNTTTRMFESDPIPGMVRAPLGIPLVHRIDGDPKQALTAVCVHSLESLSQYEEGPKVAALMPQFLELVWGTSTRPGVYDLVGLKRNLRSKKNAATLPAGDGSFNLASTVGEGEGAGTVFPAAQSRTAESEQVIRDLLQILHQLYRLIMPLCVSNFEWSMAEFGGRFNNVVAFGGLEPGPTSCQLNSSGTANIVDLDMGESDDDSGSESESNLDSDMTEDPEKEPRTPSAAAAIQVPGTQILGNEIQEPGPASRIKHHATELPGNAPLMASELRAAPVSTVEDSTESLNSDPNSPAPPGQNTPTSCQKPASKDSNANSDPKSTGRTRKPKKRFRPRTLEEFWAHAKEASLSSTLDDQGQNHGDFKDDLIRLTLFILTFRLVPGSDLGPFIWNRGGIYIHEQNTHVLFCAFRGTDIHSGYPPTYIKKLQKGWVHLEEAKQLFQRFGSQVRVGLVMYFSAAAASHDTQIMYTPSLRFLHSPPPNVRDAHRSYYSTHGDVILGDRNSRANRLGAEGFYAIKNYLAQCGLHLGFSVDTLLQSTTFVDEEGQQRPLQPSMLNIEDDDTWELICLYMRYYAWAYAQAEKYSLGLTKTRFLECQRQIKACREGKNTKPKHLPTERQTWPELPRIEVVALPTDPQINTVVGRRSNGAKAIWTVLLDGSDKEHEFFETDTAWLNRGSNAKKLGEYIHRYGTGSIEHNNAAPSQEGSSTNGNNCPDDSALADATTLSDPNPCEASGSGSSNPQPRRNPRKKRRDRVAQAQFSDSEDEEEVHADNDMTTEREDQQIRDLPGPIVDNGTLDRTTEPQNADLPDPVVDNDGMPNRRKRKRSPDSSQDYEIEAIIASRLENGVREYLIRWDWYSSADDTWLDEDALSQANDLVTEYRAAHNIGSQTSSASGSLVSSPEPYSGSEFELPIKQGASRRSRHLGCLLKADAALDCPLKDTEMNKSLLNTLFNLTQLQTECEGIQNGQASLGKTADYRAANEAPQQIASKLVDQIERNNELSTQMRYGLRSTTGSSWSSHLASLSLASLANIGATIPEIVAQEHISDILSRSTRSQICRSLIAVYQWIINLGPSLAAQVTGILQREGKAALEKKFPDLAPLVNHVVAYVRDYQVRYERAVADKKKSKAGKKKAGRHKRRRIGDRVSAEPEPAPEDPPPALEQPKDWHIPADLFGLLPDTKGPPVSLKVLSAAAARIKNDNDVYGVAADCLSSVWEQLILKPMAIVDRFINPNDHKTRTKDSGDAIRDRCITRGAILHSLNHFFGDGIFCASAMQEFWRRPCVIFPPKISRDRHFARAIERDKTETLKPDTLKVLDDYLWQLLAETPALSDVCMRMGELVHRGLLSVMTGFTLTDEQYEYPLKWIAPDIPMSLLAARPGKEKGRKQKQDVDLVPTIQTLLPSKPEFGAAAIIIREALSRKREHPDTDDTRIFRRMLDGLHPTQPKPTQYDPDQHNPIRADLRSLTLLEGVLPLNTLTTATGLSSLLVYLGTGQGGATSDFLDIARERPHKMHFPSAAACIALFSDIENLNYNRTPATRIKLDCPNVYGQANTWYSCHPRYSANGVVIELSLKQKFEPYFCEEVQQSWEAFLGPLATRDPADFLEEEKISWEDMMGWIIDAGVRGFGTGLGALQFTNTMFFAGIVRSPSVRAMAQWIAVNQDYGAFTGLKLLGFNLRQNSSAAAIRAAFMCFYHWMDHFMTQEDKDTVSFGTVFVEQLLCKIGRWQNRLMHMSSYNLVENARRLFEGAEWESGENLHNHTKFSFPSCRDFPKSVFESIVAHGLAKLDIGEIEVDS